MARVELSRAAVADLERLIFTHSLPADTRERVRRSLAPLAEFPLLGPELGGRWAGFRFLLAPWNWFIAVYVHLEHDDRIVIVSFTDGRSAAWPTA